MYKRQCVNSAVADATIAGIAASARACKFLVQTSHRAVFGASAEAASTALPQASHRAVVGEEADQFVKDLDAEMEAAMWVVGQEEEALSLIPIVRIRRRGQR